MAQNSRAFPDLSATHEPSHQAQQISSPHKSPPAALFPPHTRSGTHASSGFGLLTLKPPCASGHLGKGMGRQMCREDRRQECWVSPQNPRRGGQPLALRTPCMAAGPASACLDVLLRTLKGPRHQGPLIWQPKLAALVSSKARWWRLVLAPDVFGPRQGPLTCLSLWSDLRN